MSVRDTDFCIGCGSKIEDISVSCPNCKKDLVGMYVMFACSHTEAFCPFCREKITKEWFLAEFSKAKKKKKSFWDIF